MQEQQQEMLLIYMKKHIEARKDKLILVLELQMALNDPTTF
jgi:hypothetical protein